MKKRLVEKDTVFMTGVRIVTIAFIVAIVFMIVGSSYSKQKLEEESTTTESSSQVEVTVTRNYISKTEKPKHKKESSEYIPDMEANISAINYGYEQMNNVGYSLTDEERSAIEAIVASEGGYCGYEFQSLVAYCILNGCLAEDMRPLEIFDRGDFWLTNNVAPDETTKKAVSDVFDHYIFPTEEKVRYYYNPKFCESPAHETFKYVLTCCDCRFFADWD